MAKYNEKRIINDIRLLSLDMIDNARSGHPGICLGAAPIIYTLFANELDFDLERHNWVNRDRFVMSAGHGSALLYATMHVVMDEFSMEDLKNFRKLDSRCPGHPVYNIQDRIEVTTGPLGQGLATAVGMAIGEKFLESNFNSKKNSLFDYDVFAFCGDGDMMEGISYEACSLAGNLGLDNLIVIYDMNEVSLDGDIEKTFTETVSDRFLAMDWDVLYVKNGENVHDINKALATARKNKKPTLIGINTTIGKYSKYEGTHKVHGGPLEKEDLAAIREELKGLGPFTYDNENVKKLRDYVKDRVSDNYAYWYSEYEKYCNEHDEKQVDVLNSIINKEEITLKLDKVIDTSKLFTDRSMRDINYQVMNVISAFIPHFIGGSADVVNSTKTFLKGKGDFSIDNYSGKNIHFGVREQAMGAIMNGLALTNLRPFGSTFLAFADYIKPSIRMSAMMNLPVTYLFTHDSLNVGQDGETHIPVEQIGMLRSIPNFTVYRPCDYKELIGSWNEILNKAAPCALLVSRCHTNTYKHTSPSGVAMGGYIISEVKNNLDVILIATGSEVDVAMKVKDELIKNYIEARVVSMPNMENFLKQSEDYRNEVLPPKYKRIVIEYSNDANWYQFVGSKDDIIALNHFGKSSSYDDLTRDFEIDIASIVIKIKNSL